MARTADKTDIPKRLADGGVRRCSTRLGYNATGIQQITDQAGVYPRGRSTTTLKAKRRLRRSSFGNYAEWVNGAAWDSLR